MILAAHNGTSRPYLAFNRRIQLHFFSFAVQNPVGMSGFVCIRVYELKKKRIENEVN